jgi:hypothetical protein
MNKHANRGQNALHVQSRSKWQARPRLRRPLRQRARGLGAVPAEGRSVSFCAIWLAQTKLQTAKGAYLEVSSSSKHM